MPDQTLPPNADDALLPISMTIAKSSWWTGIGRTELYALIGQGKIKAIKNGRRTLIITESLRDHVCSLPEACIGRLVHSSAPTTRRHVR